MVKYSFEEILNSVLELRIIINKLSTEVYYTGNKEFEGDFKKVRKAMIDAYKAIMADMTKSITGESFADRVTESKNSKDSISPVKVIENIDAAISLLAGKRDSTIGLIKDIHANNLKQEVALIKWYFINKKQVFADLTIDQKEKFAGILRTELMAEIDN